jgi:hypothetical protein
LSVIEKLVLGELAKQKELTAFDRGFHRQRGDDATPLWFQPTTAITDDFGLCSTAFIETVFSERWPAPDDAALARLSVLAVLRLITNSNLVGSMTVSSPPQPAHFRHKSSAFLTQFLMLSFIVPRMSPAKRLEPWWTNKERVPCDIAVTFYQHLRLEWGGIHVREVARESFTADNLLAIGLLSTRAQRSYCCASRNSPLHSACNKISAIRETARP